MFMCMAARRAVFAITACAALVIYLLRPFLLLKLSSNPQARDTEVGIQAFQLQLCNCELCLQSKLATTGETPMLGTSTVSCSRLEGLRSRRFKVQATSVASLRESMFRVTWI